MAVFVLDRRKKPLMPCSEKRARLLLERGRARVHRLMPFTIRLVDRLVEDSVLQPVRLKLDPGSKITGIALVREEESVDSDTGEIKCHTHVLWLGELIHRGHIIRDALTQRAAFRRRRRSANLRHRAPRFMNRTRPKGWIAPSLRHRVETILSWVRRLMRWTPVKALSQELVRFDMQQMQNKEITGIQYQQGTLSGYEVREYLLEKWNRTCAYCDAQNVPLQIEHIVPKSRGGSDRISNLTLACHRCNTTKGVRSIEDFLAHDTRRMARIKAQVKTPLKDASAVNSTRWALFNALNATGLSVSVGTGGKTKWNRQRLNIPKGHALDAACVGDIDTVLNWQQRVLQIQATGRGSYQHTRLSRHGFPRGYLTRRKSAFGFRTGDLVRAVVPAGTKAGTHTGRVAIRATGSFNLQTPAGLVQGIHHRHCHVIQRADGYGYSVQPKMAPTPKEVAGTGAACAAALSLPGMNAGVSRANA